MNIQELATLAECQCNVKIVLLINGQLGLVRQQQSLFYGGRYSASKFDCMPDFAAIARGFGIRGIDLTAVNDAETCLLDELQKSGPALISVSVHSTADVLPMVPPGAANRDMIESHASKGQNGVECKPSYRDAYATRRFARGEHRRE